MFHLEILLEKMFDKLKTKKNILCVCVWRGMWRLLPSGRVSLLTHRIITNNLGPEINDNGRIRPTGARLRPLRGPVFSADSALLRLVFSLAHLLCCYSNHRRPHLRTPPAKFYQNFAALSQFAMTVVDKLSIT